MTPRIALMVLPSLIVGLTLHEFAHAWVASLLRDDFPRRNRRVSLNPFRHLSVLGTLAFFFLLFGWAKPVPVNPYNYRRPKRDMLLVSLAGPAANLLAAGVCWGLTTLTAAWPLAGPAGAAVRFVHVFVWLTLIMNVVLAAVNLLPVPPLDGAAVWPLLVRSLPVVRKSKTTWISIALLVVLVYSGGLRLALTPIVSALASVLPMATDPDRRRAAEASERGIAAYEKSDFDAAERQWTLAAQAEPDNPYHRYCRSMARANLGRYQEALQDIRQAIEMDPQEPTYRAEEAAILRERDRYLAHEAYQRGIQASRDARGLVEADRALTRAIELDPSEARYYSARAEVRTGRGMWVAALADLDRAIELAPASPEAYEDRAVLQEHLGHPARAASDRAKAAELRWGASRPADDPPR